MKGEKGETASALSVSWPLWCIPLYTNTYICMHVHTKETHMWMQICISAEDIHMYIYDVQIYMTEKCTYVCTNTIYTRAHLYKHICLSKYTYMLKHNGCASEHTCNCTYMYAYLFLALRGKKVLDMLPSLSQGSRNSHSLGTCAPHESVSWML